MICYDSFVLKIISKNFCKGIVKNMAISRQQQIVMLLIELNQKITYKEPIDFVAVKLTKESIDNLARPNLNDFMINVALNQFLKEITYLIGFEGLQLNKNASDILDQLKEISLKKVNRSPLSSILFTSLFGNL